MFFCYIIVVRKKKIKLRDTYSQTRVSPFQGVYNISQYELFMILTPDAPTSIYYASFHRLLATFELLPLLFIKIIYLMNI